MTNRQSHRNGFTFLECLVVMFTILLLVMIVVPGLSPEKQLEKPVEMTKPAFGTPVTPESAPIESEDSTETPAETPDLGR